MFSLLLTEVRVTSHWWGFKFTSQFRTRGLGRRTSKWELAVLLEHLGVSFLPLSSLPRAFSWGKTAELSECCSTSLGCQDSLGNPKGQASLSTTLQAWWLRTPCGTWPPCVLAGGPDRHRSHFHPQNLRSMLFLNGRFGHKSQVWSEV